MRRRIALTLLSFCLSVSAWATETLVNVRASESSDKTRLVIEWSGPVSCEVINGLSPPQTRILCQDIQVNQPLRLPTLKLIERLEIEKDNPHRTHLSVHLKQSAKMKHFWLEPTENKPRRLVIDWYPEIQARANPHYSVSPESVLPTETRPFIVAIDAGHGGKDPGAVGTKGTLEKTIVLQVAKKLAERVNEAPHMIAYLTRESDEYIPLRDRTRRARMHGADLFISLHADGYPDSRVEGASVFVLSDRGASSEAARWLANSENASDLMGGIPAEGENEMLAHVLFDLSQSAARTASYELGNHVLDEVKKVVKLHKPQVESAGFIVLKAPDIPSILVETGFISSPKGEKKLRSGSHQYQLAEAIYQGIETYLKGRPRPILQPESRWTVNRHLTVESGDTLSGIAAKYKVTVDQLKSHNRLKSDRIHVGQILRLP